MSGEIFRAAHADATRRTGALVERLERISHAMTRTVFPGLHIRPEGGVVRLGLNLYPLREWQWSRGFILSFGNVRYRYRYSPKLGVAYHGWQRRFA